MGKVLALDLSKKNTGWAVFVDGNLATTGEIQFSEYKSNKALFEAFRKWLVTQAVGAQAVVYEAAKPRNMNHSALHFGMIAVIQMVMPEDRVHSVSWSAAKKVLTGNGHATKDDMLAAARSEYPMFSIESHDQADAIAVGLSFFANQTEATPF